MSSSDNVIMIGKKRVADYVLAAIILFNAGHNEVIIKGQGDNINKAVDTCNILLSRLRDSIEIASINIDSFEHRRRLVPVLEIKLRRKMS